MTAIDAMHLRGVDLNLPAILRAARRGACEARGGAVGSDPAGGLRRLPGAAERAALIEGSSDLVVTLPAPEDNGLRQRRRLSESYVAAMRAIHPPPLPVPGFEPPLVRRARDADPAIRHVAEAIAGILT